MRRHVARNGIAKIASAKKNDFYEIRQISGGRKGGRTPKIQRNIPEMIQRRFFFPLRFSLFFFFPRRAARFSEKV